MKVVLFCLVAVNLYGFSLAQDGTCHASQVCDLFRRQDGFKADILMLGNSYTRRRSMPDYIKGFAKANNWELNIEMQAEEDVTFEDLNTKDEFKATIDKAYDIAILQEQSTRPGEKPEDVQKTTFKHASDLVQRLRAQNPDIRIIFYETWGRINDITDKPFQDKCNVDGTDSFCTYDGFQRRLHDSYNTMAWLNAPAEVAPVGDVIQYIKNNVDYSFYTERFNGVTRDSSGNYPSDAAKDTNAHQSEIGTYLLASVLSNVITYTSNVGTTFKPEDVITPKPTLTDDDKKMINNAAQTIINAGGHEYGKQSKAPCKHCLKGYVY